MERKALCIYDFDHTIYHGNSTVDFYSFLFVRHLYLIYKLPRILWKYILYKLRILTFNEFFTAVFSLAKGIKNIDKDLQIFWKENKFRIKKFYLRHKEPSDIIISSSPEFLLQPICEQLGVRLVATKFDIKTGKLDGKLCYGEEKVIRLNEMGIYSCERFYTDSSRADASMIKISDNGFIVQNNQVKRIWNK